MWSGGASLVAMVQAADFEELDHAPFFWSLRTSWRGRVFRQRERRLRPMIVGHIPHEHAPQMRLVEDDHMIEALATNGSDQALT